MSYNIEKFELVKNQHYYFYVVSIDEKNQFKSFLEKYDLNKSDLVYLVAFSGGFDSMCLLHALKKSCKNYCKVKENVV